MSALALVAGILATVSPASADVPGTHPAYDHGLRDLRVAHQLLEPFGFRNVTQEEEHARRDVDRAYRFALGAAERDRKDIDTPVGIDANLHERDRLVRALSALRAAHRDFTEYETNGAARGWRHEAVVYVDRALVHAQRALRDQHWDRGY